MIFNFTDTTRFCFFREPVDMHKGIHSLYHLIKISSNMNTLNGDGYVFIGRTRKTIKVLRWQKDGFILYNKKHFDKSHVQRKSVQTISKS